MLSAKNERDVVRSLERIADSLEKLVKIKALEITEMRNAKRNFDKEQPYADMVSAMNNYANNKEENKDGRED